MGLFIFSFGISELALACLVVIAIGAGLFRPVCEALFAQQLRAKPEKMDGFYTVYELVVNIGAFAAPLLVAVLIADDQWQQGLLFIAGVVVFVSLLLSFSGRWLHGEDDQSKDKQSGFYPRMIVVFGLIILSLVYWLIGDSFFDVRVEGISALAEVPIKDIVAPMNNPEMFFELLNVAVLFVGYLVFSIIWFVFRLNSWLKVAAGLLLYALAWQFVGHVVNTDTGIDLFSFLIAIEVLLGVSELFVSPIITSLIAQHSPKKLMATSFGLLLTCGMAVHYSVQWLPSFDESYLGFATAIFVILAIITMGLAKSKISVIHKP